MASSSTVNQELLQAIASLFLKLVPAEDLEANKREINKAFKALNGGQDLLRVSKKKLKDKDAPKKAKTAFMYFSTEKSPALVANNDEMKSDVTKRAKRLGEMWQETSDKDKKKFFDLAEQDKIRYREELAAYNKSKGIEEKPAPVPKAPKAESGAVPAPKAAKAPKAEAATPVKVDVGASAPTPAKATPKAAPKGNKK